MSILQALLIDVDVLGTARVVVAEALRHLQGLREPVKGAKRRRQSEVLEACAAARISHGRIAAAVLLSDGHGLRMVDCGSESKHINQRVSKARKPCQAHCWVHRLAKRHRSPMGGCTARHLIRTKEIS